MNSMNLFPAVFGLLLMKKNNEKSNLLKKESNHSNKRTIRNAK